MTLNQWRQMTGDERLTFARSLAVRLPDGFEFVGVRLCRQGAGAGYIENDIAFFRLGVAEFALVPGGTVRLGFDTTNWSPDPREQADWEETVAEFEIADPDLRVAIADAVGEPRTVEMPALLAQTRVDVHPTASLMPGGTFRLPTPDEWEWLCGAGAPTLFRWGDHAPCDRYPADTGPVAHTPDPAFEAGWDAHRAPNAWGLYIAYDPYEPEQTSDPDERRGGDDGSANCGGLGFFAGWLPLATAYILREPSVEPVGSAVLGRRVLTIP